MLADALILRGAVSVSVVGRAATADVDLVEQDGPDSVVNQGPVGPCIGGGHD
jgi:hypothetical protein